MVKVYKTHLKESTGIGEEIFLGIDAVEIHKYKVKDWIGKLTGKISTKKQNRMVKGTLAIKSRSVPSFYSLIFLAAHKYLSF